MKLDDDRRRELVESVAFAMGSTPFELGHSLLGAQAMRHAPGGGANTYHVAEWAVGYVLSRSTPGGFINLVSGVDPAGTLVEVQALVAQLEAGECGWTVPGHAAWDLWMPDDWPFIDRAPVRQTLGAMAAGNGPFALAIEGPFGHGKRTIGKYVGKLADDTEAFNAAVVELRGEPQSGLLDEMIIELAKALGIPADVRSTHAEPERAALAHANQIVVDAMSAPAVAWFVAIVIDEKLEDGVLAFVDSLLGHVRSASPLAGKLRVIVVCQELSRLELDNAPALDVRHALTEVTDAEVREWFEAAVPGRPPEVYALSANAVMAKLSDLQGSSPRRLRQLSYQCGIVHRQLVEADTG